MGSRQTKLSAAFHPHSPTIGATYSLCVNTVVFLSMATLVRYAELFSIIYTAM